MQAFVSTARTRSFSRAAEELGISQVLAEAGFTEEQIQLAIIPHMRDSISCIRVKNGFVDKRKLRYWRVDRIRLRKDYQRQTL
jgi:hypothetical protein